MTLVQMAGVRIGTSGYVYPHWRKGVFYPSGLPSRQELAYYAARFRTVELAVCIPVGGRLEPDRMTTAPFTCIRMHRGQEPAGGFTKEELKSWAAQVRALAASGKEIYIYFNNDWEGFALRDAVTFERLLGLEGSTRPGDVQHPQDDRVLSGLTIPPTR